jgi:hypothetical protein
LSPCCPFFEVGEHQLGLDRLGIRDRIDLALDVRHVTVGEAAQHVDDRVHLADVAEELVAEPFTLRCAAHQPGDVDERQLRLDDLGRTGDLGERIQARIGHRDVADVGLDRAERVVGRLRRRGLRQRVEKGGLADVRQAHDAAAETHGITRI